uniref:Uncharacterized protein n=1 Tax=Arundo donax TaxID=35708 RepID=A0A0A9DJN6_ARUDO
MIVMAALKLLISYDSPVRGYYGISSSLEWSACCPTQWT